MRPRKRSIFDECIESAQDTYMSRTVNGQSRFTSALDSHMTHVRETAYSCVALTKT
jgi:hypothetical protein